MLILHKFRLDIKIPDYRILNKDGESFLVEVKNFGSRNLRRDLKYNMTQEYWKQLKTYSRLTSIPVKIGIFWRVLGSWTLNDLDEFESDGTGRKIALGKAFMHNQMFKLGDKHIATKSPLVLQLIMEPNPLDIGKPETNIVSKIIDVQMCIEGNLIVDKHTSEFACFLFRFGEWKKEGPRPIIKNNTFCGVEFSAKPVEETGQGCDIISTLSTMYTNIYNIYTYREDGLPDIYMGQELTTISDIIPENPFNKGLPLWIFIVKPARRQHED